VGRADVFGAASPTKGHSSASTQALKQALKGFNNNAVAELSENKRLTHLACTNLLLLRGFIAWLTGLLVRGMAFAQAVQLLTSFLFIFVFQLEPIQPATVRAKTQGKGVGRVDRLPALHRKIHAPSTWARAQTSEVYISSRNL